MPNTHQAKESLKTPAERMDIILIVLYWHNHKYYYNVWILSSQKSACYAKLNSLKISHEIIHGGFTSSLQPLDMSLNMPFKDYYTEELMDSQNPIYTNNGNRQKPLIQ